MTLGHLMPGSYFANQARTEIDAVAKAGIPSICIVPTVWQESFSSSRQFRAFGATPADDQLKECIDYAHGRGLEVMLRPMLECMDGATRLHIRFPRDGTIIPGKTMNYWRDWFGSMAERARHYAYIAQVAGCEAYGLDSELDGAARDGTVFNATEWRTVLQAARSQFAGPVTTNHTMRIGVADIFKILPDHWFKDLDFLELNFFVPLAPGAMEAAREHFRKVAAIVGKPVSFGACGCRSVVGGELEPSGWNLNDLVPDNSTQVRYLEALQKTFAEEAWWGGLIWHQWSERTGDSPATGFSLMDKPAAEVLSRISKSASLGQVHLNAGSSPPASN